MIGLYIALGIVGFIIILYFTISILAFCKISKRMNDVILPNDSMASKFRKEKLLNMLKEDYEVLSKYELEEVDIKSCLDNIKLHGYFYHTNNPKGTAILFHGFKSNPYLDVLPFAKFMIEKGYDVLLISHRGHGLSEGKHICFAIKERYDCKSWCDYVSSRYPNRPILLEGISMGGTTVTLASNFDLGNNVKMVIDDCGYTNAYDVIDHVMHRSSHLPKKIFMPCINLLYKITEKMDLKSISTTDSLKETKIPVLFLHGTKDRVVPYYMGEENYKECASEKEFISVKDAGHGLSYIYEKDRCDEVLNRWIEKYM